LLISRRTPGDPTRLVREYTPNAGLSVKTDRKVAAASAHAPADRISLEQAQRFLFW
jgi:hypothetical protein